MPVASARPLPPLAAATEPAQATQQRIFLPLIRAGGTAQTQRSTRGLIDAALAAGTITRETALLLKAQAVLDDPALPAAYRGSVTGDDSAAMMREVRIALPTLSAGAQARLRPYLLPPSASDSWYARSVMGGQAPSASVQALAAAPLTWQTLNTANGKAKIWYHPENTGDAARAQQIAGEIDGRIWSKLAGLFERELPDDCGAGCVEGGGDGRLDIYLVDRGWSRAGSCCDFRTGHVELGTNSDNVWLVRMIAAVWLDTVPVADPEEYGWMVVAMQMYAVHHVYPTANDEHRWAERFLNDPRIPLEQQSFGAYLLFFEAMVGRSNVVAAMLRNAMNPDSLAALDKAIEPGLVDFWRSFALYNWNDGPVKAYFQEDQLVHGARLRQELTINSPGETEYPIEILHLAAQYNMFHVGGNIRQITFTNPIARDAIAGGHVWALLYLDGGKTMVIEDWQETARRVFCRDNPEENVTSVVLIVSNGNWKDREAVIAPGNGIIEADANCGATDNTLQWSLVENAQTPGFERSVREQASVQVRLRYDAESGQYLDDGSTYSFSGSSSTSQIDANGVGFRGTGTSTGSGAIVAGGGSIGAHIEDGSPRHFVLGIQLSYRHQGTITYLPSGATETVSSEGVATLTCAEKPEYGDQLYGRETTAGNFSMSCTLSTARDGVTSLITVSGSISISP
jgi:hypothetical protein